MPSYAVPPYAIGRNFQIQITPQTEAVDGTLSNHTIGALTFNGRLDMDDQDLSYSVDNISPRDAASSNPVIFEVGSTFTITEIAQAWPLWTSGSTTYGQGNTLEKAVRLATKHLISISMLKNDGTTQIAGWSAYVIVTNHRRSSPKGKNNFQATFQTILVADTSTGLFQSNPSIS